MDATALERVTAEALVRVSRDDGAVVTALWSNGTLRDLGSDFDGLLRLRASALRSALEPRTVRDRPVLDPTEVQLLAPAMSQEVWAAGVTYRRSREARIAESQVRDVYARVYEAQRPELFYKSAGWRVVPTGGHVAVRSDSTWNVPEPELAVLSNAHGEVVAFACANDMSSRSIEAENPLYLPQAKIYDGSCAIGPAAVLAWQVHPDALDISMTIVRDDEVVFDAGATTADLVRNVADLTAVLHSASTFPYGAWLLTGTSLVPPADYSSKPGDVVRVAIEGLGELTGVVALLRVPEVSAAPRIAR